MYILCLTAEHASRVLNAVALILFTDISFIIDFDRGQTYFKNGSMCFNIFLTSK